MESTMAHVDQGRHLRRLQKMKTGSYVISVPPGWVKRNGLKPHDTLLVIENHNNLVIKPIEEREAKVVINLDQINVETALYMVQTYYMQGAEVIEIRSSRIIGADVKRRVKEMVSDLVGVEINDMSSFSIVLNVEDNLRTLREDGFRASVAKFFRFVNSLLEDLRRALVNGGIDLVQEMLERSKDVQRRYRYIIRLLSRMSQYPEYNVLTSARELIVYATLARDLARLVYHLSNAVDHVRNIGHVESQGLEEMVDHIMDMFTLVTRYFEKYDVDIVQAIRREMSIVKELEERVIINLISSTRGKELMHYLYLARELRRIAGYCVALMDDLSQLYMAPTATRRPG